MKRLLLLVLCLFPAIALGQGVVVAPKTVFSVVNGTTRPIANATITVCAANVGGIPCSPGLTGALFKDAALTQPLPNPFQADANGNYNFAIATGSYTVTETGTGFAGYSYQLTVGGAGVNTGVPGEVAYYGISNGVLSPQPNLSFSGANSSFTGTLQVASDGVHPGLLGIFGQTTAPNLPANSVSWIGPPLASFSSYGLQFPSSPPTNGQSLLFGSPSGAIIPVTYGQALPTASAQLGDTLRFNVNGDSNFDAVNIATPVTTAYAQLGGSAPFVTGPMAGAISVGAHQGFNPTASVGPGDQYSASATGSTSTVIGYGTGQNGNNSISGMLAFYRWTLKLQLGNTTNVRYWMGLGCWNNGSVRGNNATAILGTTAYAADTPNKTTLGFRFSAGTDTHWQAVAAVAGGSQTTTDTGITPDLNPHIYEMTTNAAGTSVFYFIDGTLVATITTNLPVPSQNADSWGDAFWSGDNKNTATAISAVQFYMAISQK